MSVIKPELSLLQMPIEGMPGHTVELHLPALGVAPKALNTVDMGIAPGKLIVNQICNERMIFEISAYGEFHRSLIPSDYCPFLRTFQEQFRQTAFR